MMNGIGANEVFVETPDHEGSFFQMDDNQIEELLWAYRDRILDLQKDGRLRYTLIFKNYGLEAGALLRHPHSQLIALPIVPKVVTEELEGAKRYYRIKERCVFCDIARQEIEQGIRLVAQNKHFLTFAPFAPRFPFETWILPKRHESCFTRITREEMMELVRILKMTLRAIAQSLGDPAYNFLLHIAPNSPPQEEGGGFVDEFFHWHLEIMPRLIRVAGFEWGSGLYFNPNSPEESASKLREALA
jgi:UDPglucose--hexose-1-phosphate uridylyltransferase